MLNKEQLEVPPDRPYLMFWFLLTWALMIIALIWGISKCKVEYNKADLSSNNYFLEAHFAHYRNGMEKDLQITKSSLIGHGVPYLLFEHKILATLTAYNPVEEQCDSTPLITASNKMVREGYVANNCLPFGTIVKIDGKYYEVQDRMNSRYGCEYFDILMFNYQEAIDFGRRTQEIKIIK